MLVAFRPDPSSGCGFIKLDEICVSEKFEHHAARLMQILDRYYQELWHPSNWAHLSNVLAALDMASSMATIAKDWMVNCPAHYDEAQAVAQAIFVAARDKFGSVATSRTKLMAAEIAEANAAMVVAMLNSAERERCSVVRIFA